MNELKILDIDFGNTNGNKIGQGSANLGQYDHFYSEVSKDKSAHMCARKQGHGDR